MRTYRCEVATVGVPNDHRCFMQCTSSLPPLAFLPSLPPLAVICLVHLGIMIRELGNKDILSMHYVCNPSLQNSYGDTTSESQWWGRAEGGLSFPARSGRYQRSVLPAGTPVSVGWTNCTAIGYTAWLCLYHPYADIVICLLFKENFAEYWKKCGGKL